eukprot:6481009-Amphidinium_carterae.1
MDAVLATPGSAHFKGLPARCHQCVVVPTSRKALPLLQWSVKTGFQGLTTPLLRELLQRLRTHASDGSTSASTASDLSEEGCIKQLVHLIVADACDETVVASLAARAKDPADGVLAKTPVDLASDLRVDSEGDESDCDACDEMEHFAEELAASQSRQLRLRHLREGAGSRAKRKDKSSTVPTAMGKQQIAFTADKPMTAVQAQAYAPPGCRILLENSSKFHRRWKANADYMQQMYTKTFHGRNENLQCHEALLLVLGKAWDAYSRKTGQPCPYVLAQPGIRLVAARMLEQSCSFRSVLSSELLTCVHPGPQRQ